MSTPIKPPTWFWIVGGLALLWNLMGVMAYIAPIRFHKSASPPTIQNQVGGFMGVDIRIGVYVNTQFRQFITQPHVRKDGWCMQWIMDNLQWAMDNGSQTPIFIMAMRSATNCIAPRSIMLGNAFSAFAIHA